MGIYCFFESVAQAAKKEAGYELCWWETGMVCERRYRVGEQCYNLRPDVALGLSHRTAAHTFLAGVGSRHDECARSGHQVCLVCTLPRFARVGKRVRAAAPISPRKGECRVLLGTDWRMFLVWWYGRQQRCSCTSMVLMRRSGCSIFRSAVKRGSQVLC